MCRQAAKGRPADNPHGSWCTALGQDQNLWDADCLLRPAGNAAPSGRLDLFIEKLKDLCADKKLSQKKLHDLEDAAQHDELKDWYIRHGKMSGIFRSAIPKSKIPRVRANDRRRTDALLNLVLERDNYRCQYCGCRLIVRDVWKRLEELSSLHGRRLIKTLNQRRGVRDEDVSGLIFATWPFPDHVLAYTRGGSTDRDNLVACCFACNYGKDDFACEELGITDPRSKPKGPIINSDKSKWGGLQELILPLNHF